MDKDDEQLEEEPSSRHLLVALEDLLKRSHNTSIPISKIKYQSKSVDDLLIHRRHQKEKIRQISSDNNDNNISNTTRTEFDLSGITYDEDEDNEYDLQTPRSRSAPASPTHIYDKELAAFIDCDQQQQQSITDNFVYNIDLSDSNETSHPLNSRLAIFFEDDYSPEEINYEPSINLHHSSHINSCLTITEENEEELEQLKRDDDEEQQRQQDLLIKKSTPIILLHNNNDQIDTIENDNQINKNELSDMNNLSFINIDQRDKNNIERLSTIYESPSPQPEIDDDIDDQNIYDKLIIYDIANVDTLIHSSMIHPIPESTVQPSLSYRTRLGSCYTDASFEPCPNFTSTLTASRLCGTTYRDENSSSSPVINTKFISLSYSHKSPSPSRSSPMLFLKDNNILTTPSQQQSFQHIQKMKMIQSSSSSLSDFISSTPITNAHYSLTNCSDDNHQRQPSSTRRILTNGLLFSHCASNPIPRRHQDSLLSLKRKTDEKIFSNSSSSSELLSSSDEKLLTRSEFLLQEEQTIFQQRKASSLKSISMTKPQLLSKILYPIDFQISWYDKSSSKSHKVPTSDSGIVIDTRLTSNSSIEDDQNEINYRKTLMDLTIIKKNLVDIESRLNETMQEVEIEQALIEGEHELVFKQILDASECDQDKIRQLYKNLQLLIQQIMTEKNSLRNQIDYTQQLLLQFEKELNQLEHEYQTSDENILKKKEMIAVTRKKHEDLEFQLMELETRCESELEQAEENFQNEQKLVTQNAKLRQNTLRELDHQQYTILHQATIEKEKLERERQKLKLLFKQKKIEINQLEQKIYDSSSQIRKKDDQQDKLEIQLGKMSIPEEYNIKDEYQVKLREKNRTQERPLTRYLPIRSPDFDLRAHIEGAGHFLDSSHLYLTSTSCRGYLYKMGGMKFKTWNRRWFLFDRQQRSLSYYQDKNQLKLRGSILFQSILEVYVDHLQSISIRSPEPRQATFIVKTNQRSYYLVAPTIETMRIWIDVIITGAEGNTFAAI